MTENETPGSDQPGQQPKEQEPVGGTSPPPAPSVPPRRGQVSHQDAGTTKPRPPTLAEQRARREAEREERARIEAEESEAARKAKLRRRLLIGGGVTVGVVALVAIWYSASQPSDVTARCVDQDNVVVDDDYCDDGYARSHGGYSGGSFIYIGGRQYGYNYGGSGGVGQKISGGSSIKPSGAEIKTNGGKSIQRGGFGVSSGGSKGGTSGGSSGGS